MLRMSMLVIRTESNAKQRRRENGRCQLGFPTSIAADWRERHGFGDSVMYVPVGSLLAEDRDWQWRRGPEATATAPAPGFVLPQMWEQ